MTQTFSFKELTNCDWNSVIGKQCRRMDTNVCLGEVYAKYPKHCGKLSALMNNGRVEFILRQSNEDENPTMTVLFGCDFHEDAKIFIIE